jgi:LysM domain
MSSSVAHIPVAAPPQHAADRRSTSPERGTAAADGRPSAGTRLTRRGRVTVLAGFVACALAVLVLVGAQSAAVPADVRLEHVRIVHVQSGQTLWDIARSAAPDEDPRAVVQAIVDLNALPDAGTLQVGEEIAIPDPR